MAEHNKHMPKTHNNLMPKVVEFDNIHNAYLLSRKGKRFNTDVLKFTENLEENLIHIQNELIWKTYLPSEYREFYVFDPKKRLISAPSFRDRVVHHSLVNIIEPLFERKFISDSYACRKGKGNHTAMKRVQYFSQILRQNRDNHYVLKADVSKYFYSIDKNVLISIIKRTIRDNDVLWLIKSILNPEENPIGIPIGALTSQLFANVYLDKLDHYVKEVLGVKNYVRYMDDFIILHPDKGFLKSILIEIEDFLKNELHLQLNGKTQIFPYKRGVDFCGYRIWPTHILPRKRIIRKTRSKFRSLQGKGLLLKELKPFAMNFIGYIKHCNGYQSKKSILNLLTAK